MQLCTGTIDRNVAVARVGADGETCFVNSDAGNVHLTTGQIGPIAAANYQPPTVGDGLNRLVDTRSGLGGRRLAASERRCFEVPGVPRQAMT